MVSSAGLNRQPHTGVLSVTKLLKTIIILDYIKFKLEISRDGDLHVHIFLCFLNILNFCLLPPPLSSILATSL